MSHIWLIRDLMMVVALGYLISSDDVSCLKVWLALGNSRWGWSLGDTSQLRLHPFHEASLLLPCSSFKIQISKIIIPNIHLPLEIKIQSTLDWLGFCEDSTFKFAAFLWCFKLQISTSVLHPSRWGLSLFTSDNWTGFRKKSSAPSSRHLIKTH